MDSITELDELEKFSPLADRRPFEVILRGGKPWGFTLAGGEEEQCPLHVSKIAEGSRAENSALLEGDIVLSVNGIACGGFQAGQQLIDSAFRTLTLKVLRGGWDTSRGARAQAYLQRTRETPPRRERSGSSAQWRHAAHDDSALYTQSKASQQQAAMKPSRPRRGDSFTVGKSNPPPSPSTSDPPWSRLTSGHSRPGHSAPSRSSYPGVHDQPQPTVKSDRRYSDAPARYQPRDRDRDRDRDPGHPMVSSKSSPNLNKAEAGAVVLSGTESLSVKSVKSSSDIPEDVDKEKHSYRKRPSMYEQQLMNKPASHTYHHARYSLGEVPGAGDYRREKSKRYSEDMYTSDMKGVSEPQAITSHSLQKYQPDYENVSMLGTASLQSEKISEIDDIDDGVDGDVPAVPPRPACVTNSKNPYSPTPPQRDPSSLKYIKVNQNHEKYPSWPVTQPSAATDPSQPINTRAQSWTDHTNTQTEFPSKQRLAYQPGLRPLLEKNSPTSERKGEESGGGKAPRNSSDPGFKTPEFVYDRYGKVVQKQKEDKMKGRFEDFYHNSKPGYLPPRFDSDGHSYGDKEYSAPSPPERDVAGVDRHALSQALGTEAGDQRQQPQPQHKPPQQAQPQEPSKPPSHAGAPFTVLPQRGGPPPGGTTATSPSHSPPQKKRPGYLPTSSSQPARDTRRVDMATSPLASPRDSLPGPGDGHPRGAPSASHRDYFHRDSAGSAMGRQSHKPFIVKQTPYYNTSTQTDVQSYAVKMSDPRTRLCNVEIQVGEVSSQTSPNQVEREEKSIQARMSREFQPSELDHSSPKKLSPADKRNYFNYPFEGMQSIQAKYATDEDSAMSSEPSDVFTPMPSGDQASIMRKLSEEFYGSNKLGLMGDKRHSSASSQEHSPKPLDCSSVYSGTMSQAESYSSVVIHPSESAGPFGRDDFGSQSSITDSRHDLSFVSSSRSSLRDTAPRGRNSLEFFPRAASRPLLESKKFNSLSAISHQRESSAPVLSRFSAQSQDSLPHSQDALSVDTRWRSSGSSYRSSSSTSEISSPSQPVSSPDARTSTSSQFSNQGEPASGSSQSGSRSTYAVPRHARVESVDSVFSEHSSSSQRERGSGGGVAKATSVDSGLGRGGGRTGAVEMVGRKPSMKKAYGIYDENDRLLSSPTKDSKAGVASSSFDTGGRTRGSYSDTKQLDQIQEEADVSASQVGKEQRLGELVRHPTQGDVSEQRPRLDSWRSDLDKRTGRSQWMSSEQVPSSRDRSAKMYEPSSRPQRLFDGSIDSGVGSETSSRMDGQTTPSEPSQQGPLEKATGAELKKFQQQAVLNFVQRKTGKVSASVEHSPEPSLYESIGTPRSPHSPTSESVSDLISKTNENLAKRADSIRRSGSSSSRASSSDYVDMNRQERSRKETEWSRLRSSGSFHYGSNRSSLCSENTYEDISVFATPTPCGSTQEVPKNAEGQEQDSRGSLHSAEEDSEGSKMESGVMASPTYQNFPGASRRRPPPPPPRTPSPELRSPPALPPRNYLRRDEEAPDSQEGEEGGNVDEAKIDFKSLVHQWESNSPRENDYAVELRKQAMMKFSGQRGSASTTPSSASMSVIHSRTQMGISTSYKREPMVAQEATTPTSSAASSASTTPSVTSTSSLSAGASSSSAHRQSGSEVSASSAADGQAASVTAQPPQTKEYFPQHAAAAYVDRDSKPTLRDAPVASGSARPPQLPERTVLPPREDGHAAPRADNLPARGESHLPRDRNVSEVPRKDPERSFLCPPDASRERSSSDTHALAKPEVCAVPATVRDNSRSPAGKHSDQPLPSPSRGDNQEGVVDPSELPPPPPELLNSGDGTFDKGDQQGEDPFADDSYGAYRNRSSRQVGTYKRSASAAVIRPDNHHLKAATDAHAVFSDRKLGNQNWNSDSQLQSRSREAQQGGSGSGGGSSNSSSSSNGVGGPPGRPPDRAGNVPACKADSGPVRGGVVKVSGVQPLVPHGHPQGQSPAGAGRGGGGGETFTARPYHVEQSRAVAPPEEEASRPGSAPSPKQPRSVKERISNLERKSSFSSSSSATPTPTASPMHTAGTPTATHTPTSTSQRWANAAPFGATHRAGAENVKPQRGNNNSNSNNSGSNNNRVPASRSMVLTDPYQGRERDRPPSGSPAFAAPASSTQNSVTARPRAYSERSKQGGEASDPKPSQRFAEVAPMASDARALPGHVRNSSQASGERPRSSSSPYNRRESAPAPQIPPDTAVAMVSPRRKSEGNFLSSHAEVDTERSPPEMTVISHGRQPSQEELECDQQAKELAREVAGSEKKLSDVLSADSTKKRMKYMDGLFSSPLDGEVKTPASVRRHQSQGPGDRRSPQQLLQHPQPTASADATDAKPAEDAGPHKRNSLPKEYFVSPPKAVLEMEWRNKEEATDLTKNIHDNEALIKQKEELIGKLYKKADLLKEERKSLQEEIEENEALGKRVCEAVDAKCQNPSERDKFHTYIDDLEKIVRLLLNLSGQLARAENAVQGLPENADPKLKKMTLDKRERLQVKHAEAKQLKEDIDKRSETVSAFLRLSLTAEELQDYAYFIKMKSKLTIELQELEDKITLGQEQIQELKKSIPERIAPPAPSSSPSSSPPSSPVPSS